MKNIEKFNQSYTDLVGALYDITEQINTGNDWDLIRENLSDVSEITTILKRMGETAVLEIGEQEAPENELIDAVDGKDSKSPKSDQGIGKFWRRDK